MDTFDVKPAAEDFTAMGGKKENIKFYLVAFFKWATDVKGYRCFAIATILEASVELLFDH